MRHAVYKTMLLADYHSSKNELQNSFSKSWALLSQIHHLFHNLFRPHFIAESAFSLYMRSS